jgi:hypothetical protein
MVPGLPRHSMILSKLRMTRKRSPQAGATADLGSNSHDDKKAKRIIRHLTHVAPRISNSIVDLLLLFFCDCNQSGALKASNSPCPMELQFRCSWKKMEALLQRTDDYSDHCSKRKRP